MYIGATPVPDTESETGMVRAQQSISTKGTTDQPNLMQFKYGLLLFFLPQESIFSMLLCTRALHFYNDNVVTMLQKFTPLFIH
jgi:hypothetical protein